MPTPLNAPLIGVWWEDINKDDQWGSDYNRLLQPVECYSCGHIVEETSTYLKIGAGYDYRADTWASEHAIPIGAITDRMVFYDPPGETE